jgi:cobalt/nickel transport system permease protein
MHIPDGYLSPATCAALYAGAAPFWYLALRRVKAVLHTRLVPVLSLMAAFSFVIMMFNIPLPGGSTGHAVGIGAAVVLLGPWASVLALSMALVIQALFFGDGGITAIGANCFNIAVVGSLVAWVVYRGVAGRSVPLARRRAVAAGLAGYAGINAAAVCTAIELGIQPMLYSDGSGAPLYCPYPLAIAVPAMMLGHLTVAGVAELTVSAGIVAFAQRSDPALLKATAGGAPARLRPLWLGLAALLVLSPLGILAAGSAWGEWAASDFDDPRARQEIAAASLNQPLPARAPQGMARLASIWTAPMHDYAPAWIRSAALGYLLSAMFGTGLIILFSLIVGWIARRNRGDATDGAVP